MSAASTNKRLNCYIVCPGFLYGYGEDFFYNYFKKAWLQDPSKLPIIGNGKNSIPTIHIRDLISLIIRIIHKLPEQKYILAVDRTKERALQNIVSSISKSVGSGKTDYLDNTGISHNSTSINTTIISEDSVPKFNELQLNVKAKTSKVFNDEKKDEEEEEDFEKRKFKWHCEFGIPENLELLRKEFTDFQELKPVKLIVTGPPGAGKTTVAKKLAKFYNLPHINISDIIEYAKSLTDELGEEVKTKIDEERDKEAANLEEIESKKKKPKEIIKEEIKEFIPHDVLSKVIKRMLKENLYRNRGYILEGYPKSFSMAKNCFYEINEEPQENEPKEKLLDEIMPNSLVKLLCTKNQPLIDRFKVKSEEELKNTHYNEKDMNRRLATYRQENESTTGEIFM